MKINSMFYVSVLFTAVMIFSVPLIVHAKVLSYAQEPVLMQASQDARNDAEALFNDQIWYFAGCFFSFGGYFLAKTYYSPVPAIALLGQSPDYVAVYTDTYRSKMTELRSKAALNGCIHGAIAQFCLPTAAFLLTNR